MATHFPIILDSNIPQLKELPVADRLNFDGSGISNIASGNLQIIGGASGQALTTNGLGGLYWAAQGNFVKPVFRATKNVAQNITSGTNTSISFNLVDYDNLNYYNSTNSTYTPAIAGYYLVNLTVGFATNTSLIRNAVAYLYKNSGLYAEGSAMSSLTNTVLVRSRWTSMISTTVYLSGTDSISVRAASVTANNSQTTVFASTLVYFQAEYIAAP